MQMILASLKDCTGDLDRVKRVVRLLGMVNGGPDFRAFPKVIDGASGFVYDLWSSASTPARPSVPAACRTTSSLRLTASLKLSTMDETHRHSNFGQKLSLRFLVSANTATKSAPFRPIVD